MSEIRTIDVAPVVQSYTRVEPAGRSWTPAASVFVPNGNPNVM